MAAPDLGKMVGPLPLGAWVAVVGGGLAYMLYTRSQSNAAASTDTSSTGTVDDTSGVPGVGDGTVGGWVDTTPASTTTTPTTFDSDEAWGSAATNWLIAQGYNAATADSAIRKYLDQESGYSAQEYALVTLALAHQGSPPVPLPAPIFGKPPVPVGTKPGKNPKPPVTVKKPPKPKPKPVKKPPVRRKPVRTYTVKRGDNLTKIAMHFYHHPDWQRIYNANRAKIGGNPNSIRPGEVLTIP